ncbi:hypothetical protein F899_01606 [Acinetobacter sp. CIP 101934]|uniref:hypothetical protein n=1 Tax=Acinetobacter sp. CIP 101934 TaxID=1144661 RepID=UPI0002D0861F|nr:hypothetical protein [Acinetobacter sp. CIP 101934]ENX00973.1 hypothetical protein F899_01606 [Acinetobacter sp. CIP 101934]
MTAEIAILNPHGVALAADSAVTIGTQKIINSAIKLFSLSKTAPVGVMVYGNASLLGMPWETLIKFYRKRRLDQNFNSLEEYGRDFINFINENINLFPESLQVNWFKTELNTFIQVILNDACLLEEQATNSNPEHDMNFLNFFNEALEIAINFLTQRTETCTNINFDEVKVKEKISADSEELFLQLKTNNNLLELDNNKLLQLSILIIKNHLSSQTNAGIVISGFGESEIYPSILTYDISGIYLNTLIFKVEEDKTFFNRNGEEPQSQVLAFAQEDVVVSFLKGVNSDVRQFVTRAFDDLITNLYQIPLKDVPIEASWYKCIEEKKDELINNFNIEFEQFLNQNYLSPMYNMIHFLPKDELAAMAESLVNITAFKRKMLFSSLETVGGPIDVAVISKGDGLVWVKRKHYFDANLNRHFFDNYFKG